jgi:DNA invertase Pin-like site-specific DNA recombinase
LKVSLHFTEFGEVTGSDAMGSVFVKLLSVFAEFYSKQCSEKQKATKDRLKSQGRFGGGKKLYGYDVDQNNYLIPCEKEQQVIRQMQLMRKQGNSYRKVADQITKSTRKTFPVSWVFKILNREGVVA